MHEIEPYYRWRDEYVASEDDRSPFYEREYDEFTFSKRIYNFLIHPQWDDFGSQTLYIKVIMVDYDLRYAVIELIGEWNDCINNDIMFLKREIIDAMQNEGVNKFIILGENVLNFHSSEEDYYEEWFEDLKEQGGWVVFSNFQEHVVEEMRQINLDRFVNIGQEFNLSEWRSLQPQPYFNYFDNHVLALLES